MKDELEDEEFLAVALYVSCGLDLEVEKKILSTIRENTKVGMWTFIVEFSDIVTLKYKSMFQNASKRECASFQRLLASDITSSILMPLFTSLAALFRRVGEASEGKIGLPFRSMKGSSNGCKF